MKAFILAAGLALAALAWPALAADVQATPATLGAVSVQPGDRILLSGVTEGQQIRIGRKFPAPGVTIEPGPGTDPKVSFYIVQAANVTIRGFKLGGWNPVSTAEGIVFDNVRALGNPETGADLGIQVLACTRCAIRNSRFSHLGWAIQHSANTDFVIEGNDFRQHGGDMIRDGKNTKGLIIRKNTFSEIVGSGAHRDAIQLWTASAGPTERVTIEDNIILRGAAGAQGIFLTDLGGTGYVDLVIRRNAILGPQYHCIAVQAVKSGAIVDNFCQGIPGVAAWYTIPASTPPEVTVARNWSSGNAPHPWYTQIKPATSADDRAELDRWKAQWAPPPAPKTVEERLGALEAAVAALQAR